MTKNTATPATAEALVAPFAHAQKVIKDGLDKVVNLNLETLQATGKANLALLESLAGARTEQGVKALGDITQRYFREAHERTVAYFQSSFALAQDMGTQVKQSAAA